MGKMEKLSLLELNGEGNVGMISWDLYQSVLGFGNRSSVEFREFRDSSS